jgi:hypothetical protein
MASIGKPLEEIEVPGPARVPDTVPQPEREPERTRA